MSEEKKVPNPNGRSGGEEHQNKIKEVANELEKRNLFTVFERFMRLFSGKKKYRFVDIAAFDKETGKLVEVHQIGVNNKDGTPVKREREALEDINNEYTVKTFFHAYKTILIFIICCCIVGYTLIRFV